MVSLRCKLLVKDLLEQRGILHSPVELGEVQILSAISDTEMEQLGQSLISSGFELLKDKKSILVERIKSIIIDMVHLEGGFPGINFSAYLTGKLHYDYTYLANVFSEVKGSTIERYIIINKIERAKELLEYNELTLTEISYKLNYSSVAHLSTQFKKVTGQSPTGFKKQRHKNRNMLEDL